MKKIVVIIALVILGQDLIAQQEQNQCPCCSESHSSFDFWIGEWTVYDIEGNEVGKNTIEKQYDNCVLQEKWISSTKNRGTSYNYYDSKDKTWNQVWVDNSGFNLVLKGNYDNGKMILKSQLLDGKKGKYYNQITWVKNDDGTVTQIWDIFNNKDEKIQEAFKGIYKKTVKTTEN